MMIKRIVILGAGESGIGTALLAKAARLCSIRLAMVV